MRSVFAHGCGLVFVAALVIVFHAVASGQDLKPVDVKPAATDTQSEVKLRDVDIAQLQNVQLFLANLQLQVQNAQLQIEAIRKELPAMIEALYKAYKLSKTDWLFDEVKMQFVRRSKPEAVKD